MSVFDRAWHAAWQQDVADLLVRMAERIETLEERVKLLEMADATATAKGERQAFTEALVSRMTVTYDSGETLNPPRRDAP